MAARLTVECDFAGWRRILPLAQGGLAALRAVRNPGRLQTIKHPSLNFYFRSWHCGGFALLNEPEDAMDSPTFSRRASDPEPHSTRANVIDFARRSEWRAGRFASNSAAKIRQQFSPNPHAVLWKGLLSRLAAGFAATVAMTLFQLSWSGVEDKLQRTAAHKPKNSAENQSNGQDSSTAKLANAVSQA